MEEVKTGSHISRYEIVESVHRSELIGIYKAYDSKLERNVYLKTILHSADYSQEAVDFFLSESRSLAKMSHPNIAKVLDFGKEDGNLYLVSEYVPGTALSELMTHPIPWQEAVEILLPLTEALAYAHSKGIIHRDLKPDNIIINSDNQPILSDFSLMRIIEEEETRDMTGTNVGLGSPEYISPEQGKGLAVDFRSDIYSLGVVFFEMVTGKKLFYASNSMEIVIQHVMADPPKPRSIVPSLPRSIEEIILNALSKDRDKRYQTMDDFADSLKAVTEAMKEDKKPKTLFGSTRALVGVSAIGLIVIVTGIMLMSGILPIGSPNASAPDSSLIAANEPATAPTKIPPTPTSNQSTPTESPATPSAEPSTKYNFPLVPALPGADLPSSNNVIDTVNAADLVELARWGMPDIVRFELVDNEKILLAGTSAGVYYLDTEHLAYRYFFDTGGSVTALAVSEDEEWVVTGDSKGSVAVWNVSDGKLVHKLEGAAKKIELLDISPDKSKVVFTDADNLIHLWNLNQNLHYPFEKKHLLRINDILFLSNSNTLISGGDDFQIYVWDVPSGKASSNIPASQKIIDMDLSSDDQYLAISLNNANATIQIWDWQAKKVVNTITDGKIFTPFTYLALLPNNQNVLTTSADGFVRLWNVFGTEKVWETPIREQDGETGKQSPIRTISVASDGTKFVVMFDGGLIEVWDLGGQKMETSREFRHEEIKRLAISPNDRLLAFQGGNSFVSILSTANGAQSVRVAGTLPRGNPISPDSRMIAVRSNNLILHSLSATVPQQLFTMYGFPTNGSVNYLPDSDIITVYAGGIMKYWSTSSGLELTPSLRRTEGYCIKFIKRDDTFLVAGSEIGVIYASEYLPGFCQVTRGPRTTSEKFLSDGSIIALSTENQSVQVWDLRAGGPMKEIKVSSPGSVLDTAISADGKLLTAASSSGTIEIYDLETGELLKTLDLKTGPINQITFSNDGKFIISGSADGTVRFFGLYP